MDYDFYPMTGEKKKPDSRYTRETNHSLCGSRPDVSERPADTKEPSLNEGVSFTQKMAGRHWY